jgi:membrane associated rhomboid family serine protease
VVCSTIALFGIVAAVTIWHGPDLPVRWFAALGLSPGSIAWYTPLTYWVLHEHLLHLSANMLFLMVFGAPVEAALGRARFLIMLLTAAVITGLVEAGAITLSPDADTSSMVIGASGPVACVLGVFAARYYRARIGISGTRIQVPAVPVIAAMAIGEMVSIGWHAVSADSLSGPTAAHWAHIAGFMLGIGWAHISGMVREARLEYRRTDAHRQTECRSQMALVDHWEAVVAADPGDSEAVVRLVEALDDCGERDRAAQRASQAISARLDAGDAQGAVDLYLRVAHVMPLREMPPASSLALAAAMVQQGKVSEGLAAYDALVGMAPDAQTRRTAQLRAVECSLRSGTDRERVKQRLEAFLAGETDADWRAYALRLMREAGG